MPIDPNYQYAESIRITSYNVCYTKLLRQLSEFSVYVQNGNAGSGTITLDNLQVGKASNEDPAALAAISVTSKSVYRSAGSVTLTAAGTDQHGDAYSLNGTVWSSNLPILVV